MSQTGESPSVFVFTQGECKNLAHVSASAIQEVRPVSLTELQIPELMATINNLGRAVNRNAFFLKGLSNMVTEGRQKDELRIIYDYVVRNNAMLNEHFAAKQGEEGGTRPANKQQMSSEKSGAVSKSDINAVVALNAKLTRDVLREVRENSSQLADLRRRMETTEGSLTALDRIGELSSQIEKCNKKFGEVESSFARQMGESIMRTEDVSKAVQAVKKSLEDSESRIRTEMKYLSQKVTDSHKAIVSQSEFRTSAMTVSRGEIGRFADLEEFKDLKNHYYDTIGAIADQIRAFDFEAAGSVVQRLQGADPVALEDLQRERYAKKIAQDKKRDDQLTELISKCERLGATTAELVEKEAASSPKLEKAVADLDHLSKTAKAIARLKIEMKGKANREVVENDLNDKLDKTVFDGFLADNGQFAAKIDEFYSEFTVERDAHQAKILDLERQLRGLGTTVARTVERVGATEAAGGEKSTDRSFEGKLLQSLGKEVDDKIRFLADRFEESKRNIVGIVNARLNSLATTRHLSCLSCGTQDVNYPPLIVYAEGSDKGMYHANRETAEERTTLGQSRPQTAVGQPKAFMISKNKSQTAQLLPAKASKATWEPVSKTADETKTSFLSKSRIGSAKPQLIHLNRDQVTGEEVFNREAVVREHLRQMHGDPVTRPQLRPFSSVPQRHPLSAALK